MIKEGEVRPEGCICEPSLNIMTKWGNMRSKFGYTTLYKRLCLKVIASLLGWLNK